MRYEEEINLLGETKEVKNEKEPSFKTPRDKEFIRSLRDLRGQFKSHIESELKSHSRFIPKSRRLRKRIKRSSGIGRIVFTPFEMSLPTIPKFKGKKGQAIFPRVNSDDPEIKAMLRSEEGSDTPVTGFNKVVSVFIVSRFEKNPPKIMIQKVAKKGKKGIPGGTPKSTDVSLIYVGAREYQEETGAERQADETLLGGINILSYAPIEIGQFPLHNALFGEMGIVLFVSLPEKEIQNIKTGGGDGEEEKVTDIWLATHDQIEELIGNNDLSRNSVSALEIYFKYISS